MKKVFWVLTACCLALAVTMPPAMAAGNNPQTILLVQSEEADGSVTFSDSSVGGTVHQVDAYGAHHSTGQANFGSSSVYFNGSSDYLEVQNSDDFNFGTGDFTIDFWLNPEQQQALYTSFVFQTIDNGYGITICVDSDNSSNQSDSRIERGLYVFVGNPSATAWDYIFNDGSVILPENDWSHIALVRTGDTLTLYVNGQAVHSGTRAGAMPAGTGVWIGGGLASSGNRRYTGHLEEFRISKDIARTEDPTDPMYAESGSFTPASEPYDQVPPPLAISAISATPVSGTAPLAVDFDVTPTGGTGPYTFAWDFGDGATGTGQAPSHTYTAPGAYSAQVVVTDADGNTATDSAAVSVQAGTAACSPHAVFDTSANILTIPYLDVPLVDPISQQEIEGADGVFTCTMAYVPNSGGSFSITDLTFLPNETADDCHAKYTYDGTIFLPNVDVPAVIVLPWGNIVDGPVETYEVTLQQLLLDTAYFHLTDAVLK